MFGNICEKQITLNFINKKDPVLNEEFHTNYKKYRNLLSTLMTKSKQASYNKYFERSWHNIKNKWKGIQSVISLKDVASNLPPVLSFDNGDAIILMISLTPLIIILRLKVKLPKKKKNQPSNKK